MKRLVSRRISSFLVLAVLSIIGSGCMAPAVRNQGIVAWNYKSVVPLPAVGVKPVPGSMKVQDIESKEPSMDLALPGAIIRFVPIACIWAPPSSMGNKVADGSGAMASLKAGELQQILSEEIIKAGIVTNVAGKDDNADFVIKGSVNFDHKIDMHFSGLGIFYLALVPPLIVPASTDTFKCEAHLEVVSAKSGAPILAKDYEAETRRLSWALYNTSRMWSTYGAEVFPQIVGAFIADVKAIPESSWTK